LINHFDKQIHNSLILFHETRKINEIKKKQNCKIGHHKIEKIFTHKLPTTYSTINSHHPLMAYISRSRSRPRASPPERVHPHAHAHALAQARLSAYTLMPMLTPSRKPA
jgi:hypothetical protein